MKKKRLVLETLPLIPNVQYNITTIKVVQLKAKSCCQNKSKQNQSDCK